MTETPDIIDAVLGIEPGSPLDLLRRQRPVQRERIQSSFEAALFPTDPRNLPLSLRAALARRMSRLWNSDALADHYLRLAVGGDPETLRVADPAWDGGDDPRLRAILRHVDLVTRRPRDATGHDIAALAAQGLDDRDIVTLAGLIAFVNFQILVVAGLRMLGEDAA